MSTGNLRITNLIAISVFIILIFTAIFFTWFKLYKQNALPFKQVKIITTANYIQPEKLQAIIKNNLKGGFFSIKINHLKNCFLTLPWVADVAIKRQWPNRLQITITEQQPVARWNQQQLINQWGKLFTPPLTTMSKQLPWLQGPPQRYKKVWQQFQKFNLVVMGLGLKIEKLQLSPRMSWRLQLNNGVWVVLGREEIDQRLRRFVRLYQRVLDQKNKQVVSVDCRYPNGIAVRWKKQIR